MINASHVRDLVEQVLQETDCFLVDVHVTPMNKITVSIDRKGGIAISQCVEVSRFIEKSLDRDTEDFELEVSSAGMDQPFKVLKQYLKNAGREVDVKMKDGKKVNGILLGADESGFSIKQITKERIEGRKAKLTVETDVRFSYDDIKETKLVIKF